MSARVICISRALAAGGETVGQLVSAKLGFRYVDEEIISLAADKAQVDSEAVAKAEHRQSIIARLMDAIAERGTTETPSYFQAGAESYARTTSTRSGKSLEQLRKLIREAIVEVASRGDAVIVAHAASYALSRKDGALRVLVTASEQTRVDRMQLDGKLLSESDAVAAVKESDRERREYLRAFYDVREEQMTDYDLVINSDALTPEQAAASVIAAASAR